MIVYHATKQQSSLALILASGVLIPGRNVSNSAEYVHLSKTPFKQGSWALDVIGPDTNQAWILTCLVPDGIPLLPDPSGEGADYDGEWVVHTGVLAIEVIGLKHIPNVQAWELGHTL
jgi:hypothetical protein